MAQLKLNLENIEDRLRSMEFRLSNLESDLAQIKSVRPSEYLEDSSYLESSTSFEGVADEEKGLESRVGRIGLAWLGNVVLLFAVLFFNEYLTGRGNRLLSVCIGVITVVILYLISTYLKKSNPNLSILIRVNSQVILFYEALHLYFFSDQPLISNKFAVFFILLLIIGFQIFLSIHNKSKAFGFLASIMMLTASLLVDSEHLTLSMLTLTAIMTVYFFVRFSWNFLLITSLLLIYTSFFIWLFGNPVMGHPMTILPEINFGHLYLFAIGGCFSVPLLFRKKDGSADDALMTGIILNGFLFTLILALISKKYFNDSYVILFSLITACCLIYSIILRTLDDWKFSSAFYALYGFLAMSISLYGLVGMPAVFLLLSVQSLIVVAMALWFRNRLMIIMNSALFLIILLSYMLSAKSVDNINFAFAIVPLISARIINWQKARLDIKTDLMRNLYLIAGFVMVLYALYHAIPKQFITLSWTASALFYFLLSLLLRNVKYRYMALGTMVCTALNLLLNDMSGIDIIYRVLALLFLAVVSIGISIYYSKRIKQSVHQPTTISESQTGTIN